MSDLLRFWSRAIQVPKFNDIIEELVLLHSNTVSRPIGHTYSRSGVMSGQYWR